MSLSYNPATLAEQSSFRIVYDGPALKDGTMPVRELAPALISLGELFTEASRVLYPDAPPVALNIKATEEGSFDVHLIVQGEEWWGQLVDTFSGDTITALVNLKTILIGGGGITSVFAFLKWLNGRKIEEETPTVDPGQIRVKVDDGTTIELSAQVAMMTKRVTIRRHARRVVEPLTREGVDELQFTEPEAETPELVIGKEDVPSYEVAQRDETVIAERERETLVQVAGVSFEGHKWRLTEGDETFHAAIDDEEFKGRVRAHEALFGDGDLLQIRLRTVQTQDQTGKLHADHRVVKVLKHIPAPQMRLNDVSESDASAP